jgi:CelD/BcsL family acetyltransferase involved in cellulose biosynthesis
VRLVWLTDIPEQMREPWNALVLLMQQPEVFFTSEWALAMTRAYGTDLNPWIACAYEGEELVGVAALARPSPNEAVFLAGNTADYCDFISHPEKRQGIVAQVLAGLKEQGIRSIVLANLPEDSATVAALERNEVFRSFLRTGYDCAQVRLGSLEQRQQLIESLPKKKVLRRALAELGRIGPVTLRHDQGGGSRLEALDEFFVMHVARFLRTGRISNLAMPQRRGFLTELARLLAERGWFDLMSLYAGDRRVSSNYGFRFHGSWFWYQPTLDNDVEDLSPGFCLLAKIVEDACKDPEVRMVDLGLGAEEYKERFANAQRITLHATLSAKASTHWKAAVRYRAAQAVKRRPALESLARRAQAGIARGQQRIRKNGVAATVGWAGTGLRRFLASHEEVLLFRWPGDMVSKELDAKLSPLNWNMLARAAMRYSEDHETLDYLLRAAGRFQSGVLSGYALLGPEGEAQHFAWATPYEGFEMQELGTVLKAPSPSSVMIFDCWTPGALRGRGLYGRAIRQLAALLTAQGAEVWIFSAAANPASVAGIEKAGFQRQFALVRRKILSFGRIRQERRQAAPKPAEALSKEAVR